MMIPWCAAYDKVNYARYLSIFHAQMTRLEEKHLDIYHHMMEGSFSVQRSLSGPVDNTGRNSQQGHETAGGTKGFNQ